jgi:hypothetical protein
MYTGKDDGALWALGNGSIIAYGHGAEWEQAFGSPYTSPTALSLRHADAVPFSPPVRDAGRGAFLHRAPEGTYEDAVGEDIDCLARRWRLMVPARWRIGGRGFPLIQNAEQFPGCRDAYLLTVPGGTPAYNWYPTHEYRYMQIVFMGDCDAEQMGDEILFTARGEGLLYVASGDLFSCAMAAREALKIGFDAFARERGKADVAFLKKRRENARPLDEGHPLYRAVQAAADDVALFIRAQQGASGGVLAGSNYHMAYVRDQYGVSRGLLALGCFEEAKEILRFYRDTYQRSGRIHNAQGIGVQDMFHVHENDLVEITGYLLAQACDYLDATGDRDFFETLRPMLNWAIEAQTADLHLGMLPFNGDETYVAGGILPRTVLLDGSMEATMLLIRGVERLAALMSDLPDRALDAAARAKAAYRKNFRRETGWVANSRARREGLAFPEFRRGVCLRGGEGCMGFGWLLNLNDANYVCPACYKKGPLPAAPKTEYPLISTLLMHAYMGSRLVPEDEIRAAVRSVLGSFRETGAVSSLPGGGKSLGYDYGLILYAATKLGISAEDLMERMLSIRDSAGAWVEYYEDNRPLGTRCRPWESAINIEAALFALERKNVAGVKSPILVP